MVAGAVRGAYRRDRRRLVELLRAGGIEDLAVLHAFDAVPRHLFVPEAVTHRAYEDVALPIGRDQTISRPAVHALHLSLAGLRGGENVLEVGTGSGYQTALLATLGARVFSIERIEALSALARARLTALGLGEVRLRVGDGSAGWPEEAPFDVILVGAAAPAVPEALREQMAPGGRMVVPVHTPSGQRLVLVRHVEEGWSQEIVDEARFVPLIGEGRP
ncbi:MAG: protein-L-isoaspartate(D-aspartate) O-methyltransferase [Candidatus Palauibacterales bacterium]|nr:protein-L-isoaspartate(D-aspartate) O-methyltransferase [Candidatus Palauibacterales bacterium]MDP2529388.1 protein-L-isoaspartate(D-aspartate) O-methyltransferase [Candidatus Palauibacterales bacterium]MDP2583205.1 protein-L-isoaspartate(D-aspartate) O-methyltransferase [Candidatus Palauibacterales bacterium]